MMMRLIGVLLSAVAVGVFFFVAVMTADAMFKLNDVIHDRVSVLMIKMKQKARKRRHENCESRR